MVQVNGKVILIFVSVQLEVDDHPMPVAGNRVVGPIHRCRHTIQPNGIVDHLMIPSGAEVDD
jgi:hypothetical protein